MNKMNIITIFGGQNHHPAKPVTRKESFPVSECLFTKTPCHQLPYLILNHIPSYHCTYLSRNNSNTFLKEIYLISQVTISQMVTVSLI